MALLERNKECCQTALLKDWISSNFGHHVLRLIIDRRSSHFKSHGMAVTLEQCMSRMSGETSSRHATGILKDRNGWYSSMRSHRQCGGDPHLLTVHAACWIAAHV